MQASGCVKIRYTYMYSLQHSKVFQIITNRIKGEPERLMDPIESNCFLEFFTQLNQKAMCRLPKGREISLKTSWQRIYLLRNWDILGWRRCHNSTYHFQQKKEKAMARMQPRGVRAYVGISPINVRKMLRYTL